MFSREILERFDVVSWDPRGVSGESRVECSLDLSDIGHIDPTPDTQDERTRTEARYAALTQSCIEVSADYLPYLSTVATAHDMDQLREALGEPRISYLGLSYGTALGSVYATLFPGRVRAMVLDAAYDITAPASVRMDHWVQAQESRLVDRLVECGDRPSCAFHSHGDPEAAFDELMMQLDDAPSMSAACSSDQVMPCLRSTR